MSIRVRFAPSPTGPVHIGNVRTAIFGWLFARHHGGKFLLRIEDTDRERSTPEAVAMLLDVLGWFGLLPDEEPLYQSARLAAHQAAAAELERKGLAYRSAKGAAEKGEALLFRVPPGAHAFVDLIKGRIEKPAEDIQDFVILRSDGTPTFHLANVVDDIHMGITHVLRGLDHVENTVAKHIFLFRALGAEPPQFGHFPFIVREGGKPYSKRDADAFVGFYREAGYLPEALFNALALCGWSPGDDREKMSRDEMVAAFELERIKSADAQLNSGKLDWLNGQYLWGLAPEELERRAAPFFAKAGLAEALAARPADWRRALFAALQGRAKRLSEFAEPARVFLDAAVNYQEKPVKKYLAGKAALLDELAARLGALADFSAAAIEAMVQALAAAQGLKLGQVAQPLRVAVTGTDVSPPIGETLALIGKERALARLAEARRLPPPSGEGRGGG